MNEVTTKAVRESPSNEDKIIFVRIEDGEVDATAKYKGVEYGLRGDDGPYMRAFVIEALQNTLNVLGQLGVGGYEEYIKNPTNAKYALIDPQRKEFEVVKFFRD